MPTILIIDDNPAVATALEVLFSLHDIATVHADGPEPGLALLATHPVDLVIQDMNFTADTTSGAEGQALFAAIRERHPDLPVILLTAWTHLESAVGLVKAGAADYVAKPWDDGKLLATVNNLLELAEARHELARRRQHERRNRDQLLRNYDLRGLVFNDPATERVVALACQVARSNLPVLITGPNGSGKEKVAEIIQANSSVRNGPFVTLNCGALPADLIEAELFGAEAGAYTGANRAREGKFDAADGGTLFLDEIGNLPLEQQPKLLRAIEDGEFERLGATRTQRVDVRIVAATNADLGAAVAAGRFRQDLLYRLNAFQVTVPPLRERGDDILPLARHYLARACARYRRPLPALERGAERALRAYPWPGNVRELAHVMERTALLSDAPKLDAGELRLQSGGTDPERALGTMTLGEAEAWLLRRAMRAQGGNLQAVAEQLGITRQSLYRRLGKHGIGGDDAA